MKLNKCTDCNGAGNVPNENAGKQAPCYHCKGTKYLRADGYGTYKSEAALQAAIARRSAKRCWWCEGTGLSRPEDATLRCNTCDGNGSIVVEAHTGDVLPDCIGITDWPPKHLRASLAREMTIVITVANRGSTWNESYLGLGTLVSVTDYGRRWDTLVKAAGVDSQNGVEEGGALAEAMEAFKAELRDELESHMSQWCKFTTREDRVIQDVVVAQVHRNGYTLVTKASGQMRPVLPPAYTPEVLNGPADRHGLGI